MTKNNKIKILIIEDNSDLVEVYSIKFSEHGYDVKIATNGRIGLEMIRANVPDVILLDMLLPEIDGFAVLKQIKDNPKTKHIKVVALTNLGAENDIKKIFSLGVDDCMIKASFLPDEVCDRVANLLKK